MARSGKACLVLGAMLLALTLVFCAGAGAGEPKPGAPAVKPTKTDEATSRQYSGNSKTRRFHRKSCRYYNCINCTVFFATRKQAIKAGFIPCKVCNP